MTTIAMPANMTSCKDAPCTKSLKQAAVNATCAVRTAPSPQARPQTTKGEMSLEEALQASIDAIGGRRDLEVKIGRLVREELSDSEIGRIVLERLQNTEPRPRFPWTRSPLERAAYFGRSL